MTIQKKNGQNDDLYTILSNRSENIQYYAIFQRVLMENCKRNTDGNKFSIRIINLLTNIVYNYNQHVKSSFFIFYDISVATHVPTYESMPMQATSVV